MMKKILPAIALLGLMGMAERSEALGTTYCKCTYAAGADAHGRQLYCYGAVQNKADCEQKCKAKFGNQYQDYSHYDTCVGYKTDTNFRCECTG